MLDVTRAYGLNFLFPAGDQTVGGNLRRYGEFARPEVDLLVAHATQEQGTFIDVGANIGAIALPFAKQRPDWHVLAIEAHRGLAGLLAANTHANHLYRVEPIHAAAGADSRLVEFAAAPLTERGNYGTLSLLREATIKEPVRMLRLDEVAPPDTRLVKIDVEGYEAEVLEGARDLLARKETTWLAEASDHKAEATGQLLETFLAAGYAVHWFFAPFITPRSEKAVPEKVGRGDANFLALPPGAPNLWDLPLAMPGRERPSRDVDYPYLARYGYGSGPG